MGRFRLVGVEVRRGGKGRDGGGGRGGFGGGGSGWRSGAAGDATAFSVLGPVSDSTGLVGRRKEPTPMPCGQRGGGFEQHLYEESRSGVSGAVKVFRWRECSDAARFLGFRWETARGAFTIDILRGLGCGHQVSELISSLEYPS